MKTENKQGNRWAITSRKKEVFDFLAQFFPTIKRGVFLLSSLFLLYSLMENRKKVRSPLTLVQPNKVTNARYDFNEAQENIMTLIV